MKAGIWETVHEGSNPSLTATFTFENTLGSNNKVEINWEDESSDQKTNNIEKNDDSKDFAKMLAEDKTSHKFVEINLGDKVSAVIEKYSSSDVLVKYGSKETTIINKSELFDESSNLRFKEGDTIEAYVIERNDSEIILSNSISNKIARQQSLHAAFKSSIPVKGKAFQTNKAGFNLAVLGQRAFCPLSQMVCLL